MCFIEHESKTINILLYCRIHYTNTQTLWQNKCEMVKIYNMESVPICSHELNICFQMKFSVFRFFLFNAMELRKIQEK